MQSIKNIYLLFFLALFGLVAGLESCSKMDGTYRHFIKDGAIIYSGKADSIKAHAGYNRVMLEWLISDPAISKCVIYWLRDGVIDSSVVSVGKVEGVDTVRTILNDLPENTYTFTVYTYDKLGNASVPNETIGVVYGNTYIGRLNNRQLKSLSLSDDGLKAILEWYNPGVGDVGTEINYLDKDGVEQTLMIQGTDKVVELDNFEYGSQLSYKSYYIPDSTAIDTFSRSYTSVMIPPYNLKLDRSQFVEYQLPGDVNGNIYQNNKMSLLWDGNLKTQYITCLSNCAPLMPNVSFAFDLGVSAKLDRLNLVQRYADAIANGFNTANPKKFEVWGTNNIPDADGSWTNWTKLGSYEIIKPSGLPIKQQSEVDVAALKEGHEFMIPGTMPAVRYLRFKILENWGGVAYVYFSELYFWGAPE